MRSERRRFLTAATAAAFTLPMHRALAAGAKPGQPKFVLVFLRGAYDAANALVPYRSDFYYESRPHLAVPRPGSGAEGAIALDSDWALHPALRDSMLPLWQSCELAFVPFAGTGDMTRSHFETQDHIELGQGAMTRDYDDGFLNRLITEIGSNARPMAFTAQLPLSMRGRARVPNEAIAVTGARSRAVANPMPAHEQALLESMWQGTPQEEAIREGFAAKSEVMRDLAAADSGYAAEMVAASRGAAYPQAFVDAAARVGSLMRMSFNVGFIDVGGWDTHVNEASANGATGQLAGKLGALGEGLAAMARATGPAWRDTVVAVLSEFGRTFRENGNRGTDHGHGSVYWVLGGAVRGRRIVGEQIALSPATLNQNRDYPVLTSYRGLLGGIFRRQWGLGTEALARVFPGSSPIDLHLV